MADYALSWRGDLAKAVARQAAVAALKKCAADLQGKSAMQAPIDTGDLRSNCSVKDPVEDGRSITVTVGYDLPYAVVQHEHLEYRHPKGGKAKYLEDPFKENEGRYRSDIASTVKNALSKG
ncbi:MAG: HK97 gp10 family phage protein [Firmicutes bacterium]|jgi:hypothetical protein|nr:HK97 gp10 family phage protein [Bacillota bacterium]